jgi:16S rRNA (guanine527-N7)-methyltransferase
VFKELLAGEFREFGQLSTDQLTALEQHWILLNQWNKKLNLTRIITLESAVKLHYCESLFMAAMLPKGPLKIADLGSGAGFPGLPTAIFRPDVQLDLIESHQRKAVFLEEASRRVPNIHVLARRSGDLPINSYDWIVSRAVRPADVLLSGLAPQAALLISRAELSNLPPPIGVHDVPWGRDRIVAMFHVER